MPDRRAACSRTSLAARSPALPADAYATTPEDSASDLPRDPARAAHETLSPPSVRLHSPRSGPRAAPVHGGHHRPARHKPEARYFLEPIHISSLHLHQLMWRRPPSTVRARTKAPPLNPNSYLISARAPRNFCVARKSVFLAVSSVVCKIS